MHDSNVNLKKIWVIINPNSGTKKFPLKEQDLTILFKKVGLSPTYIAIDKIEKKLFDNAEKESIHAIVVIGGDGTVRSVASYLVTKKIPLGIIPAGTFNHLAKDLNIPLEVEEAIKVVATLKTTLIDIAEVNEHYFLNNSSIGLYPKAVRKRRLYSNIVKGLAMTLALINIFKQFPTLKVNYRFKDKEFEVLTPLVLISNNRYYLDLLRLGDRKRINAGKLYLYINHCRSRLKFLKLIMNVLFHRKKNTVALFEIHAVEECKLNINKPMVDVAVDGELLKLIPPLHYKIHSGAITIIAPETID